MTSLDRTRALYADLARVLGGAAPVPDENGGLQLTTGDDNTVILFGEADQTLLIVVPAVALPQQPDYALMLWLLRRNLYDSPLMPFQTACDIDGNLVLWGRVEIEGMTGERLAGLIDALGVESRKIQSEIGDAE